jgi:alpha-glucosidase (family GH31 glycosyl hydrolase)
VPAQVLIGDDLITAPFTTPINAVTGVATVAVWFPRGRWFDFVSGGYYAAGWQMICGGLERIPLFVRGSGVVPHIVDSRLVPDLFSGGSRRFTVVDDDGESLIGPEHGMMFVLEWENYCRVYVGIEG